MTINLEVSTREVNGLRDADIDGIIKLLRLLHPEAKYVRLSKPSDHFYRLTLGGSTFPAHPKMISAIWSLYNTSAKIRTPDSP